MPVPFAIMTGFISEVICRSGKYRSLESAILISGVFSLWSCGNYLPLFLQRKEYFASRASFGQAYADAVAAYTPEWMFPVPLAVTFLCGLLGGWIGRSLLKKHFERAGIA